MSRTRLAAVAATLTCAFMLVGGTGIASAQTSSTQTFNKVVKVTGTAKNGKKLKAKYTIDHFIAKGSKTYALGTLKGKLGKTHFTKRNVKMLVAQSTGQAAAAQATSCQVLDLVINPINLNLLGLVVHTDTIHLNITAVPGAGNLLGNLLCGILGILNPVTGGTTGGLSAAQLAQLLNALLGALTPVLGG
jgi:hypothetical protein